MPEEVLLRARVVRGSHVVAEKIHLAHAEVVGEIDQLMPGVPAVENMIRCLAYSVAAAASDSLQLVRVLCHALRTLRPHLRSTAIKSARIKLKPFRITKIKYVHEVTKAISITKTEDRNLFLLVERSDVLNVLAT